MATKKVEALEAQIQRLSELIERAEKILGKGRYPVVAETGRVDWSRYPPMLGYQQVAELYAISPDLARRGLKRYDRRLPTPCLMSPLRVRRDDCRRHYETLSPMWIERLKDWERRDRERDARYAERQRSKSNEE